MDLQKTGILTYNNPEFLIYPLYTFIYHLSCLGKYFQIMAGSLLKTISFCTHSHINHSHIKRPSLASGPITYTKYCFWFIIRYTVWLLAYDPSQSMGFVDAFLLSLPPAKLWMYDQRAFTVVHLNLRTVPLPPFMHVSVYF